MMKDMYKDEYLPSIVKVGRIILSVSLIVFFLPFLSTWVIYGVKPHWAEIGQGVFAWILINAPWWISEPISYFPILGVAGTFISFLSGNGSNMRIPCAVSAQKSAGVLPGTVQGSLISTIGISVSVFVNLIILAIGVLAGQAVLSMLPPSVTDALNFLLPALYGCVFAQFLSGNEISGISALVLAIGTLLLYNSGALAFIPFDVSIGVMLIPIFGTMIIAYFVAKKKSQAEAPAEES